MFLFAFRALVYTPLLKETPALVKSRSIHHLLVQEVGNVLTE
ncbi:hypothetical protein PC123_g16884 [Phytophthora cactorum]|nr:hypothetical protein PC123_g16884 [Phytophthora cactorum]